MSGVVNIIIFFCVFLDNYTIIQFAERGNDSKILVLMSTRLSLNCGVLINSSISVGALLHHLELDNYTYIIEVGF